MKQCLPSIDRNFSTSDCGVEFICYLPVLDGEVGEKLEEHESAVDVFVVGAGARPRTPVQDEQLVHFTGNLPKALTLNT